MAVRQIKMWQVVYGKYLQASNLLSAQATEVDVEIVSELLTIDQAESLLAQLGSNPEIRFAQIRRAMLISGADVENEDVLV